MREVAGSTPILDLSKLMMVKSSAEEQIVAHFIAFTFYMYQFYVECMLLEK
jgi:hypothetical protein